MYNRECMQLISNKTMITVTRANAGKMYGGGDKNK